MCGIIGYVGKKEARPILISGLKRMEYRGYDSAGIVTIDNDTFNLVRAKGKVGELENKLNDNQSNSQIGIGHTRWATHGEPSERNAHPHVGGDIAVVHNGIVENHHVLKAKLTKKSIEFASETDSEVLAWLINSHYDGQTTLHNAVLKALREVEGTFGLVVTAKDQPETLVVARRGSPIIIARGQAGTYVASDASALAGYVDEVTYLNDNELAVCTTSGYDILSFAGVHQSPIVHKLDIPIAQIQKQGYDHFLIKEIHEQPTTVESVLRGRLELEAGTSHLGGLNLSDATIRGLENIVITGCGTAYYAGLMSKYLLEKLTGLPVMVEVASEFRYRDAVLPKRSVGLVVSQSGETADTLAAARELKRRGIPTIGIVNVVGSTITREVDGGVYLHAGPEISVASTKAFTSMVIAMLLFGLHVARVRGLSAVEGREIVQALSKLPKEINAALKLEPEIAARAEDWADYEDAFYLGRDTMYPIALEGSHKLKEVSYIHAEAYAAGEMKHGANALIDDSLLTIFLLGKGPLLDKSLSNLAEVQARNGTVLVVTDDKAYAAEHEDAIYVATSSTWTAPLVFNVVLQLIAYYVSVERGCEIDQPRNLAKSVTVE